MEPGKAKKGYALHSNFCQNSVVKKPRRQLKLDLALIPGTLISLGQDGPDRRHIGGMGVTIGAATFREERRSHRTPIAAVSIIKHT
jgi:hypothetical protein